MTTKTLYKGIDPLLYALLQINLVFTTHRHSKIFLGSGHCTNSKHSHYAKQNLYGVLGHVPQEDIEDYIFELF